jgi:hypothetical protein
MYGAGNNTLLSALGLNNLTLNVSALIPSTICPDGGLLNTALGLGTNCLGITVVSPSGVAQICTAQNSNCCCSSGELSLPAPQHPLHDLECSAKYTLAVLRDDSVCLLPPCSLARYLTFSPAR